MQFCMLIDRERMYSFKQEHFCEKTKVQKSRAVES
jgi:hypothetical protein